MKRGKKTAGIVFFKTLNHSKWPQNVLHEVDFARVINIQKSDIIVSDKSNLITSFGDDTIVAKYAIKIFTRSRVIAIAVISETERDNIFKQLGDVINSVAIRKAKLRSNVSDDIFERSNKDWRSSSTHSFDITMSPMARLMQKVDTTRRLNDIDMPPFEFDPKTAEWISWSIATNHSLFLTVKQLAFRQLKVIFAENEIKKVNHKNN